MLVLRFAAQGVLRRWWAKYHLIASNQLSGSFKQSLNRLYSVTGQVSVCVREDRVELLKALFAHPSNTYFTRATD